MGGLGPSIDPDKLMARASRTTGLSDFGDPSFREPLTLLTDALEREAQLSTIGRIGAQRTLLDHLEARLYITDTFKQHPELDEAPVVAPIFIIGMPRTGTTILHELFAMDPANRVPMAWEVKYPWPPPERETYETDPRIIQMDNQLAQLDKIAPEFKIKHPMGAAFPQECVAFEAFDFTTMLWHSTHNVPSYYAWLNPLDRRPVYRTHRRVLQYLQWKCPADCWVLKSAAHMWGIEALFETYPDARIIYTHRDPVRVVASITSLLSSLQSVATDHVDPHRIARDWSQTLLDGLELMEASRDRLGLGAHQIFDMKLDEFMQDEMAMMRKIYAHFGRELGDVAETRMRAHLDGHRLDSRGTHRYRMTDSGLDPDEQRERFAFYLERNDIEPEPVA